MKSKFIKIIIGLTLSIVTISVVGCGSKNQPQLGNNKPKEIRLDFATYNIESLVLKEKGWLEQEFKADNVKVSFIESQGSNKSLEYLKSNSIDFGSTAGSAALIAKAKGVPIQGVYVYSKPEWAALVTSKNSTIKSIKDLKGKKVAVTLGTDPYIFLLRSLAEVSLTKNDIQLVPLQHADGAAALVSGQVDAWSGLDPHIAKVQVENGAKLFYRNIDFNTYGFLNVRDAFSKDYPEYVERVIKVYDKARKWIIANPKDAQKLLEKQARLKPEVAEIQLKRTDFNQSIPGEPQKKALLKAAEILKSENIIPSNTDAPKTINEFVNGTFAQKALK